MFKIMFKIKIKISNMSIASDRYGAVWKSNHLANLLFYYQTSGSNKHLQKVIELSRVNYLPFILDFKLESFSLRFLTKVE